MRVQFIVLFLLTVDITDFYDYICRFHTLTNYITISLQDYQKTDASRLKINSSAV